MWSWTMSWEPRPLRNMQHLRSIFSRHRFLLINETLILWSMNWLPYFLFVWTDQYGICKILNKYHLCKISRNVDIWMGVPFIISLWKKSLHTHIYIPVYNVQVWCMVHTGDLHVYVLVLRYVCQNCGGKLYKIKSDQAISFQFLIAPIHPLFVFSRYILYIYLYSSEFLLLILGGDWTMPQWGHHTRDPYCRRQLLPAQ